MAKTPPIEPDRVAQFERALQELEEIVQRMERGELKLEESLKLFERGIGLTQQCREALETAELRVKQLMGVGATPANAQGGDA